MWIGAAGEGRVDRYQGVPPYPETRAYVQRVIGLYGGLRHAFDENLTVASPWLAAGGRALRQKCRNPATTASSGCGARDFLFPR